MRKATLSGMALIEVIIFMVIVSVAVGATLSLFGNANRGSADLLANRQAMAIGEAMLNEVLAAPFTFCDPNPAPPNFASAPSVAACARPEVLPGTREPGENNRFRFDNVNDYNRFAPGAGFSPREALPPGFAPGLNGYSMSVDVAPIVAVGNWNGIAGTEIALVSVTVRRNVRGFVPVVVQGIRTRFAPNTLPP